MRFQLLACLAALVNLSQSVQGQGLDRRALISDAQSFQALAAGKVIRAECTLEVRMRGVGLGTKRHHAHFQIDDARFNSSQYLDDVVRQDFGCDGKCNISVVWENEHPLSATKNSKKPATLEVLDINLVGGTCIAYGYFPPADKWLKRAPEESFLEAFIREADSAVQTKDIVVATKESGTNLYSITLNSKPLLHCVEYRAERGLTTNKTVETIMMEYSYDKGFPQLIRTCRSVRQTTSNGTAGLVGVDLVAATANFQSLEFLANIPDRDFLPAIPEGIAVTEIKP